MNNSLIVRLSRLLPDKLYLSLKFRKYFGRWPNWKNPQTFSEKIQWLKLYDRRPEYTKMVDKYAVKDYVASIIGGEYVIPTLGVWDKPEDIEWDKLPNQFVLKTTHGGGNEGVVICRDNSSFDIKKAIDKLNESLNTDLYVVWREWPYKNVKKRIIAEEYLDPAPENDLIDYKFSCFDGNVTDVMVCIGRSSGNTKFYFFDKDWKLLPLNIRGKNSSSDFTLPKPQCMEEMFDIASKLSKGIPYARVDLYAVGNQPYFGEITFYPQSGFDKNLLPETEVLHGSLINLSDLDNR